MKNSISTKKILLLGTGKIGRNTCKNLVDYLGTKNITLINRTEDKAARLAADLGLKHASMEALSAEIGQSDIILVATNAAEPVILKDHLVGGTDKLIIDLSIPYNVEKSAQQLPNVTLVNVDKLSEIKDETLHKRKAEIPKAKTIINDHITEFLDWHEMRKNVPALKSIKNTLEFSKSDSEPVKIEVLFGDFNDVGIALTTLLSAIEFIGYNGQKQDLGLCAGLASIAKKLLPNHELDFLDDLLIKNKNQGLQTFSRRSLK